jgi:large subunit ribosomal protein L13
LAVKVINAEGLILGRLASVVAKRLLDGEAIIITNAEKSIVIGSKDAIINNYLEKRARTHARKGPKFPRMPDRILKRTVRGMLPYQQARGRTALKNLKVYIGVPKEFAKSKTETIEKAKNIDNEKFLELGAISRYLGVELPENK